MSHVAVRAVLDAQFPPMPPGPGRRRGIKPIPLKLVAVALADRALADGSSIRTGVRNLATSASTTVATVRCAIDALIELAVLVPVTPSNGRLADAYAMDLAVLATMLDRPVARDPESRANQDQKSRASARPRVARSARPRVARNGLNGSEQPASPTVLRVAAERPTDLAQQRVKAILADAARHAMNPDLFGHRIVEHLVDERVAALLIDDDEAVAW